MIENTLISPLLFGFHCVGNGAHNLSWDENHLLSLIISVNIYIIIFSHVTSN
jgi:hypothetical protein